MFSKLLTGFGCSICLLVTHESAIGETTVNAPSSRTSQLFESVRTICVGRFLLDVPSKASTSYGRVDAPYEIIRYRDGASKLSDTVDEYRTKIYASRVRGELAKADNVLGKLLKGSTENTQIFFDRSPMASDRYALKSFVTLRDDLYIIFGNSYASANDLRSAVEELNQASSLLRPLSEAEVNATPGFCIDGAFVLNSNKPEVERVQFGIRLSEFPDIHFSLEMTRKDARVYSDALEPRLVEAERQANESGHGDWYRRIKQLRRGEATYVPWQGYELLARLPPQGNVKEYHQFNFVSLGEPNNEYQPTVDIEMVTGVSGNTRGKIAPSITDEEAIYIWQKLLNSLRVRPIAAK